MAKTSPPARKPADQVLLIEILAALGSGHVQEGYIIDSERPDARFHGICDGEGLVTVNPSLDIVDTVIHELTHRLRPRWSERAVRASTARLMNSLSHHEIMAIDGIYQVVKTLAHRKRNPR